MKDREFSELAKKVDTLRKDWAIVANEIAKYNVASGPFKENLRERVSSKIKDFLAKHSPTFNQLDYAQANLEEELKTETDKSSLDKLKAQLAFVKEKIKEKKSIFQTLQQAPGPA